MYLIGGRDFYCVYYNDVQQYDFVKGTLKEVQTTGTKPSARFRHGSLIIDDIIYLYGGESEDEDTYELSYYNDVFSFNTISLEWSAIETFGETPLGR